MSTYVLASLGVLDFPPALTAGWPEKEEILQLAPGICRLCTHRFWRGITPALLRGSTSSTSWCARTTSKFHDLAEIVVCNSFQEAEAGAFRLLLDVLPIGPLFADSDFQKPVGDILAEDMRCLKWLDARPAGSVVYVHY
jgi:hypothetical protein